jgi:hypothetical protein
MRKTPDQTGSYRIRTDPADNWDRARGFMGDDYGWPVGEDDINGQADQLFGDRRQSAEISGRESVFDPDILAVDIAEVSQAPSERVEYRGVGPRRRRQDPNAG